MSKEEFENSLTPEQLEFFKSYDKLCQDAFTIAEHYAHSAHKDFIDMCEKYNAVIRQYDNIANLPFGYTICKKRK